MILADPWTRIRSFVSLQVAVSTSRCCSITCIYLYSGVFRRCYKICLACVQSIVDESHGSINAWSRKATVEWRHLLPARRMDRSLLLSQSKPPPWLPQLIAGYSDSIDFIIVMVRYGCFDIRSSLWQIWTFASTGEISHWIPCGDGYRRSRRIRLLGITIPTIRIAYPRTPFLLVKALYFRFQFYPRRKCFVDTFNE